MARMLGIGIATLDIVNEVERYPREDEEVRAVAQHVRRGGNATNTLVVLSQLGHDCRWGGVLVDEPDGARIREDLARHRIDVSGCRVLDAGKVPTSYIVLSRETASRTIVHHRDLPEFTFKDFRRLSLEVDWLHFEARNIAETRRMLEHARAECPALPCSLEVEKPRPAIESVLSFPDVLLFSRAFAAHHGLQSPEALLGWARERAPRALLFTGWGAAGAWALDRDDSLHHAPAEPPPQLIDTIGAGDVLNAGILDGLVRTLPVDSTLARAVRLAGYKCGRRGFDGLSSALEASNNKSL